MNDEVFDLNPKQKAAFKALAKAYKTCEKAGILFVNIYGSLTAYDKKYIEEYANNSHLDPDAEDTIELHGNCQTSNYFHIDSEWTDDNHIIKLTPAGLKLYNSED